MPISNPDLVNSCRVCRSPNQDGDYQCLYQYTQNHENQVLTEAGILYKNLLDISIKVHDCYPQFLCNSCDLQMKLFKKLKDKAYKTLEYLQGLYNDIDNAKEFDQEAASEDYESIKSDEEDESHHETQGAENEFEVYGENEIYDYEENIEESQDALAGEENLLLISDLRKFNEKEYHDSVDDECEIEIANINTAQGETEIGYFAKKYLLKVEPIENMSHESRNSADNIRLKFEQLLDKNDYVTEIYEVLDDENCFETCTENNDESLLQYDVLSENNAYISEFSDREYTKRENMDDFQNAESSEKIENNRRKLRPIRRKREYQCLPCGLKFDNVQDHKLHRYEMPRTCKNSPNAFCYICGVFAVKSTRHALSSQIKTAYKRCFGFPVDERNKYWLPKICCNVCFRRLREWSEGSYKSMPFIRPMIWSEPQNHENDCYFCMTTINGFTKKTKSKIKYPSMMSARRPVYRSN